MIRPPVIDTDSTADPPVVPGAVVPAPEGPVGIFSSPQAVIVTAMTTAADTADRRESHLHLRLDRIDMRALRENRRCLMTETHCLKSASSAPPERRSILRERNYIMSIVTHDMSPSEAQAMQAMRAAYDEIIAQAPAPEAGSFEPGDVGGVTGWWCRPAQSDHDAVVLYLHGGGYVMGSAMAHRHFVGHLVARTRAAAFIAD
jgi:hypothetical protein